MRIIGIYKIQSKSKPERVYIGSGVDIMNRWSNHTMRLKRGTHHSIILQRHFNKYGINDLMFTVIMECKKEDLITFEQHYIDTVEPYFNICKVAGSSLGFKWSDEAKAKMSRDRKGIKFSEEHKRKLGLSNRSRRGVFPETRQKIREARSVPIVQLDMEGNFIREWPSIKVAMKEVPANNISACLRHVYGHHSSGGFRWKYKEEERNYDNAKKCSV